MDCPLCGNTLSERGFFCKTCGGQVRCMQCRELLESGAVACVECGTRAGQRPEQAITDAAGSSPIAINRNTLSYHEDRNTRRFEASLTDQAMQGLGDVLGDFFIQRGTVRTTHRGPHFNKEVPLLAGPNDLPPAEPGTNHAGAQDETAELVEEQQTPTDRPRLLKIFKVKDDTFELHDNRLKATTSADYLRRLTYLFLYAHECYGRTSAPESDLTTVLRSAKMIDGSGNAYRWLKKRIGIADDGDGRIKLVAKGREEAVKALNEALDPKVDDAWNPDKKQPRKRGPRKKKS
jgi:hypothetical protein